MAIQQSVETYKVLWDPDAIQQFIATTQGCVSDYVHELMTLDPGSNWISASQVSRAQHPKGIEEIDAQETGTSSKSCKEDVQKEDNSCSSLHQTKTKLHISVTTLGLLLLSTVTHQNGSATLKEAILKLIREAHMKPTFKEQMQNLPSLKKLNLPRLESFVNFCLGHCMLCNGDGRVVKDEGVLQAWCDIVEPLWRLLESLIIDHIQENDTWTLPLPEPSNVSTLRSSFKTRKAAIYARFDSYDFTNDARYQAGVQQIIKQLLSEGCGHDSNRQDLELQAKLFYFSRFFHKVSKADYQTWLSQNETSRCDMKSSHSETQDSHDSIQTANGSMTGNSLAQTKPSSASGLSMQPTLSTSSSVSDVKDLSSSTQRLPSMNKVSSISSSASTYGSSKILTQGLSSLNSPIQQSVTSNLPPNLSESTSGIPSDACQLDTVTSDFTTSDPMTSDPTSCDPPPYPTSFLEIMRLVESGQEIPGIENLDIKPTNAPPTKSKMEPVTKPWLK